MSKKRGNLVTSFLTLFLGFISLIMGFIETSDAPKVALYCFSFVFFLIAVILFIYTFILTDDDSNFQNF